jgi:hypothetical protein
LYKNRGETEISGHGESPPIVKEYYCPMEKSEARAAAQQVRGLSQQVPDLLKLLPDLLHFPAGSFRRAVAPFPPDE